jgi:hypothetical protein
MNNKKKKKKENDCQNKKNLAGCLWLMPVILATHEAEIRMTQFKATARQIVHKTLPQKNSSQKERAGGVAQGVGPEFKAVLQMNKFF